MVGTVAPKGFSVIPDLARRRRDPAMPWLQADLVRGFDKLREAPLLLRVLL
jgi:hypothetical protein